MGSHSVLDALTNGGLGVALLAPFDSTRYFFPVRPIQVWPIGVGRFSSERCLAALRSELVWVSLPFTLLAALAFDVRRRHRPSPQATA
jgi:inner membrane protein